MKDIAKTIKVKSIKSIIEGLKIGANTKVNTPNYHPKTNDELKHLVLKLIRERGVNADLNDIDTSKITDMSYIFYYSKFNGDISKWNVSKVQNMYGMFAGSNFNGDISKWDVSNVKNMYSMFYDADFNGDISKWRVGNGTDMRGMFDLSPLEDNPPKWYKK